MENMQEPSVPNMLFDIHSRLIELPNKIRNAICRECGYSVPTVYRKMRATDKVNKFDKTIPALSNAEKQAITRVLHEELTLLWQDFQKYGLKNE